MTTDSHDTGSQGSQTGLPNFSYPPYLLYPFQQIGTTYPHYNNTIAPAGKKPMPKEVAEAVIAVMEAVKYVEKKGENKFHNYKFAAIGDVLAKVQPAMASAGLVIVQDEASHKATFDGKIIEAEYHFSLHTKTGVAWEEVTKQTGMAAAMNTKGGIDDKALNKCHSAARKYFITSLFQIPTGDIADPDEAEDVGPPTSTNPPPTRAPVQVHRGTAQSPAPTPSPTSAPKTDADIDADWDAWIEGFKQEFGEMTNDADARALCRSKKPMTDAMKETSSHKHKELSDWVNAGLKNLPKIGG